MEASEKFPASLQDVFETWVPQWRKEITQDAIDERKILLELCEGHPVWIEKIGSMLEFHSMGRKENILHFLSPCSDDLDPIVDVESLNPERLLHLAEMHMGSGQIAKRTRLEAVQAFDIATAMAIHEIDAPRRMLSDLRDEFVDLIIGDLFVPGGEMGIPIYSYHWPTRDYAVESIGFGVDIRPRARHKRSKIYLCRVMRDGTPVFFFNRIKDRFAMFLKTLRQLTYKDKPEPYVILDLFGFTLLVEDVAAKNAIVRKLHRLMKRIGGSLVRREDNTQANGNHRMDKNNKQSSPRFKAAKFEAWYKGRCFEILIRLFPHYISSKYAVSSENHDLYRIGQWCELYAPLLFPEYAFGIPWSHKKTEKRLKACKVNALAWHANPDNA